jgi:hypothetical protein
MDKNLANRELLDTSMFDDTLGQKLSREADLLNGLPGKTYKAAETTLLKEPERVAIGVGSGIAIAAVLAAANKNPALLGEKAMPYVQKVVEKAPTAFAWLMALDVSTRVGLPMLDTWKDAKKHETAKDNLGSNLGSAIVDYTAGFVGAYPGFKMGARMVSAYEAKAPVFEAKPSERIGQSPREVDKPEQFVSTKEDKVADDVVTLYEKSFPKEERQPTAEVKELIDSGRIILHTTRDGDGKLHAFSFTSMHDETAFKFANLDFIATEPGVHSKGIGSLHAKRLNELVKTERPELLGMTLEMEAVAEKGLDPEVFAVRQRRATFYDRLDAPNTNVNYKILDFEDPSYRGPAEWRAWIYNRDRFNPVNAARLMLTDEGGYGLAASNKAVREFDKANGFWEPLDTKLSQLGLATMTRSNYERMKEHLKAKGN